MRDLPADFEFGRDIEIPHRLTDRELERRRSRSLELTPAEIEASRKNRRWLLWVALPTLIVGAIAAIVSFAVANGGHQVGPRTVPTGYQAVKDGYFAYSVPKGWTTNSLFSDYSGDLYYGGTGGWAAENLAGRPTAAIPGESQPASLKSFGENTPTPYHLSPAQKIVVPGAAVGYRYTATRPGGFSAVVIDVWQSSGAELWLMIHSTPAITTEIVKSLNA